MTWDEFFIGLSKYVSLKSKDSSTKVGCVIVDGKQRIISTGFNGFPRGVKDEDLPRDRKLLRTLHAESNACSFAARSVGGCTAYVTHATCANCAALLIQHGIKRVVFPKPEPAFLERWGESYEEAMKMFREAGVYVMEIV